MASSFLDSESSFSCISFEAILSLILVAAGRELALAPGAPRIFTCPPTEDRALDRKARSGCKETAVDPSKKKRVSILIPDSLRSGHGHAPFPSKEKLGQAAPRHQSGL
jgi:hypothetical protein